ncbi:MAG: cation:proton antiporter subunit C, partial [Desulfobulbaceae bacterium]|nr:cation:proton antiporter subunit C [Desulfobulbaceae bacterium]
GHGHGAHEIINPANYVNPLPHVLMLTAIVVSVGTLGVALALALRIYTEYNTLHEDEIIERINRGERVSDD